MKTIRQSIKAMTGNNMIHLFLMLVLLAGLTGCGKQGPSVSISATPETINLGESSNLVWTSHDAESVSINNGVGSVALRGTKVVTPYRTTTYTISAVNADGKSESSVTVKVVHSQTIPVINVSADPDSIHPGQSSLLTWSTSNAYSLFVDNGIGSVPPNDYSITVQPAVTTTYMFEAIGPGGTSTASITINVIPEPPYVNITANPINIKPGEKSVLEWSYAHADTVRIEPVVGDGTQMKSTEVWPSKTTTYVITASGPGGRATARVTVIVSNEYNPLKAHIEAYPTQIHIGESSTLTWTTNNASRIWIEPGIGEVEPNGSIDVSPKETTTYVIHATQNGHESMDSVTINVISVLPQVKIIAEPTTIKIDETAILTWESKYADTIVIEPDIGAVSLSGSREVTPAVTTTYEITATGPGGVATDSVTINVLVIETFPLGNQQFYPEKAKQVDLLDSYRLQVDLSKNSDILLPEKIDWSNHIPIAQTQGTTGSGNAWAMAYYLKSFQESIEEQCSAQEQLFSPMHAYVLQCKSSKDPWDLILTWKVMQRYGCTLWTMLPFEDLPGFMDDNEIINYASYQLNEQAVNEALNYRMGTPVMLTDLDQVRMRLTQSPVVLAINDFNPSLPEKPADESQNYLSFEERSDVAHAMLCIGYDNKKFEVGALQVINSWGKDWALNGVSWIKYPDVPKMVKAAMAFNDLPNKSVAYKEIKVPNAPEQVTISESQGPYVDIHWKHVDNARYYHIFRAPESSLSTMHQVYDYEYIGIATHSPYRDYPAAGDPYLYAVVAVNELGASDHFNHQNENASHVAKGRANGKKLQTPSITFVAQLPNGRAEYAIASIDPNALRLEIFASHNELGPWRSLGWIQPTDQLIIDYYKDNTWIGYNPYLRVVAENPSIGFSLPSQAAQLETAIISPHEVAGIDKLDALVSDVNTIQLTWMLNDKPVDHIEIWRTHDIQSASSTWIKMDAVSASLKSWHDSTIIGGINYRYAVHCVHEGVSSPAKTTDIIQLPLDKPNLRIAHVEYETGALMDPLEIELTIHNNGNETIEDYTFQIMAYNWATHEMEVCLENNISSYTDLKHPLVPGNQHIVTVSFDLPQQLTSEVFFSWYILVDSASAIDEAYERDNIYWAQKMCWMEMQK